MSICNAEIVLTQYEGMICHHIILSCWLSKYHTTLHECPFDGSGGNANVLVVWCEPGEQVATEEVQRKKS